MFIKYISKFTVLTSMVCAGALAACSSQAEANPSAKPSKTTPSQAFKSAPKMGAAVTFTSNYDGRSNVGEIETLQFQIKDGYDSGTLTVKILDSDGLDIISNGREFTYQMGGSEPHILNLQVRALKEGTLSLNFYSRANVAPGQSIGGAAQTTFYVGEDASPLKRQARTVDVEEKSSGGVISMPAQEEIK